MGLQSRFLFPLLMVLTAMAPQGLQSQDKPDQQTPVFRLQVNRVPVDVVVLDKDGNPVRGLKKDDFIVKEDGKAQHVLSFDALSANASEFIPPKLPPLPANTYLNVPKVPERGPLYILYYDMVNTATDDQMMFRSELLKFVDNAPPGIRIAVFVNASGLHMLQGFTADHAQIHDAILRKGPGPHIPNVFLYGNTFGTYDAGAALNNLNFIAEYMNGIPGRKNLIWLSTFFPIPTGPTVMGSGPTSLAGSPPPSGQAGMDGPHVYDLSYLLEDTIRRTYANMMRCQMALYPVSVAGVDSSGNPHPGDSVSDYQRMDDIAAGTGGHAYYSDNRTHELIEKAITHGETYYTLSYAPTNTKFDGSARVINVTLAHKNKDYHLTYRQSYYAMSDEQVQAQHKKEPTQARFLAAKTEDTLYATIEHGAPMVHDLLFSAHLRVDGAPHMATEEQMKALEDSPAYFKTRRRSGATKPMTPVKLQKYVIDYGVVDPHLKPMAASKARPAVLEFAAAAYNDDGTLLNSMLNQGFPSGTGGSAKSNAFHAIQELEVPPGAAFIRLAVRDVLTNRTGTLEVTLPLQAETDSAQVTQAPVR